MLRMALELKRLLLVQNRRGEELLINRIKSDVEAQLTKAIMFKERVSDTKKNYISEVDRTPWGEDKYSHMN